MHEVHGKCISFSSLPQSLFSAASGSSFRTSALFKTENNYMMELVFLAVVLVGGYYGWKHRAAIWKWLNDVTNPVP